MKNSPPINRYKKLYLEVCRDIENLPALPSKEMTAEHIRLEGLRDIGVGEVLCWTRWGYLGHEQATESMRRLAAHVMPSFQ